MYLFSHEILKGIPKKDKYEHHENNDIMHCPTDFKYLIYYYYTDLFYTLIHYLIWKFNAFQGIKFNKLKTFRKYQIA